MSFKDFVKELTPSQRQNWIDFREAEELMKTGNTDKIYTAMDILRLRRQGKEYAEIVALGYTEFMVSMVCRLAGMGRGYVPRGHYNKALN